MDGQHSRARQSAGNVARRGVLAGVSALLAAALTKAGERVAQAAGNGAALTMGNNDDTTNAPTNETRLVRGAGGGSLIAFHIVDNSGLARVAVVGEAGTTTGQLAFFSAANDPSNFGVLGANLALNGPGVRGQRGSAHVQDVAHYGAAGYAQNDTDGIGVYGEGQAYGVLGTANTDSPAQGAGTGVLGRSNSGVGVQGSSNGNAGVLGTSNASVGVYANSINQYGLYATSPNNYAAIGTSNNGTGVYGTSNGNVGVLGTSNSSIGGFFSSGTNTGLYATGPASAFAARFDGPVQVNGAFTVLGGPKSAAVPHPDGTYRRLYCLESPESWFEDFGRGQLVNGRANVQFDRDFAALVHGEAYQVFAFPEGDCNGLYVTAKAPTGFEVRELKGGSSSLAFSYRVVARRKDIAGPRLERVEVAAAPPRPAAPQSPPPVPPLDLPRLDPDIRLPVRRPLSP